MKKIYTVTRTITVTQEIEIEDVDNEEMAIQQAQNARDSEWFEVSVNHVEIDYVECYDLSNVSIDENGELRV
jgi:hypothetical protein